MPRLQDVILRGTRAAQPAANTVATGSLYYVTDESVTERSSGSAWESVSDGGSPDAANVTYTPSTLANWTGSADPGQTDDALDQLASRTTTLEGATVTTDLALEDNGPSAKIWEQVLAGSNITITEVADGSGDAIKIDASGSGGDASTTTFTPGDLDKWNDTADPGATSDALDQLAKRVAELERTLDGISSSKISDQIMAGSNITITELADGSGDAISIAGSAGGSTVGDLLDCQFIRKTAGETVNNSSTFQDDNDFVLAVGANEIWELEYVLAIESRSGADFKWAWTFPASGVITSYSYGPASTLTADTNEGNLRTQVLVPASGIIAGAFGGNNSAGNTNMVSGLVKALYVNSSTAGNVTFQWAQNVTDVSDTILRAGSYLVARRFA